MFLLCCLEGLQADPHSAMRRHGSAAWLELSPPGAAVRACRAGPGCSHTQPLCSKVTLKHRQAHSHAQGAWHSSKPPLRSDVQRLSSRTLTLAAQGAPRTPGATPPRPVPLSHCSLGRMDADTSPDARRSEDNDLVRLVAHLVQDGLRALVLQQQERQVSASWARHQRQSALAACLQPGSTQRPGY